LPLVEAFCQHVGGQSSGAQERRVSSLDTWQLYLTLI